MPLPSTAQLFRRTARVRDVVQLEGIAAATQRAEATQMIMEGGASPFEVDEHLPEFEGAKSWYSGPTPACYDTPGHVGLRSRLNVTADSYEELAPDKY